MFDSESLSVLKVTRRMKPNKDSQKGALVDNMKRDPALYDPFTIHFSCILNLRNTYTVSTMQDQKSN